LALALLVLAPMVRPNKVVALVCKENK